MLEEFVEAKKEHILADGVNGCSYLIKSLDDYAERLA
jgi:hypothetical protein